MDRLNVRYTLKCSECGSSSFSALQDGNICCEICKIVFGYVKGMDGVDWVPIIPDTKEMEEKLGYRYDTKIKHFIQEDYDPYDGFMDDDIEF